MVKTADFKKVERPVSVLLHGLLLWELDRLFLKLLALVVHYAWHPEFVDSP